MSTLMPNTKHHLIPKLHHGMRPKTLGVAIHVMDGYYDSIIPWFSRASNKQGIGAHLAIGPKAGEALQMVDLGSIAYHAPGDNVATPQHESGNLNFVGIEHEGFGRDTKLKWLKRRTQLRMSANRCAWILYHYRCGKPKWNVNVVRHSNFNRTNHTMCPGPGFPVTFYMFLVNRAYKNLVKSRGRTWGK